MKWYCAESIDLVFLINLVVILKLSENLSKY